MHRQPGALVINLQTPPKVEKLRPSLKLRPLKQRALHAKAKREPDYRFYLLYDKLYREDVLKFAHRVCKANGGAPGTDGRTFADIESYGRGRWLGELTQDRGLARADTAASVAMPQAGDSAEAAMSPSRRREGIKLESLTLSGQPPLRRVGAGIPSGSAIWPLVCERVKPCPRAGCGKSARPVRRAGCGNGAGPGQ